MEQPNAAVLVDEKNVYLPRGAVTGRETVHAVPSGGDGGHIEH